MSDESDDYLWSGQGPVVLEIASLERELGSLRWQPRELPLPAESPSVEPIGFTPAEPHLPCPHAGRIARRPNDDAPGWSPWIAGLLAAAAVIALLVWLRGAAERPSAPPPPDPTVQPSGSPPAGELLDPFGGDALEFPMPSADPPKLLDPFSDAPEPSPPSSPDLPNLPNLKDPFAGRSHEGTPNPDLVDPFYNSQPAPKPPRPREGTPSPDLKDPFGKSEPSKPLEPGKLQDPFGGDDQKAPSNNKPDLKDPFARQ